MIGWCLIITKSIGALVQESKKLLILAGGDLPTRELQESSVTRWLDYFSTFGYLLQWKLAQ